VDREWLVVQCLCRLFGLVVAVASVPLLLRLRPAVVTVLHMCWCVIHPTQFLGCPCSYVCLRMCLQHACSPKTHVNLFAVRLHSGHKSVV
jgi:hypothetical protein